MSSFKLAINMAGAISAGAYTAGVLDFLVEALDEWHAAKAKWEADPANARAVPLHEVSIEAFSGASAGGMCAAIACIQTEQRFAHVKDTGLRNTDNRLYEGWVNMIDIRRLLETRDLTAAPPLLSLLDSTVIEEIARFALAPGPAQSRNYISDSLTLYVTLTNLRGVPYGLDSVAQGSLEQTICYYGDRLRFQRVPPGGQALPGDAKPLPTNTDSDTAWEPLRVAAMATGAFPVFLAPRIMERETHDYGRPLWPACPPDTSVPQGSPPKPEFSPPGIRTWQTLNIDGGVIDNDPFDLAHDHLTGISPPTGLHNPREASKAHRAVLTVAPFPAAAAFDPAYRAEAAADILSAGGRLVTALISQSRFFGESLAVMMDGTDFSRFVIAPDVHSARPGTPVLQCGTLGAFGGFFERGYRAHDFALGRRNCQKFLQEHFVLPAGNLVMREGLQPSGGRMAEVLAAFRRPPPNQKVTTEGEDWLPIVPLCGTAATPIPRPLRAKLADDDLDEIVKLVARRFKAVVPLLAGHTDRRRVRILLRTGSWLLAMLAKGQLKAYLRKQLP